MKNNFNDFMDKLPKWISIPIGIIGGIITIILFGLGLYAMIVNG